MTTKSTDKSNYRIRSRRSIAMTAIVLMLVATAPSTTTLADVFQLLVPSMLHSY